MFNEDYQSHTVYYFIFKIHQADREWTPSGPVWAQGRMFYIVSIQVIMCTYCGNLKHRLNAQHVFLLTCVNTSTVFFPTFFSYFKHTSCILLTVKIVMLLVCGGLVNGPYALITTAVSADLVSMSNSGCIPLRLNLNLSHLLCLLFLTCDPRGPTRALKAMPGPCLLSPPLSMAQDL